jgi:hypothetical protein
MNSGQIVQLWNSLSSSDRILALNEIIEIDFNEINEIPNWVRIIFANALYHDFRNYDNGYEIWIDALLKADGLCKKYGWHFSDFILTEDEVPIDTV